MLAPAAAIGILGGGQLGRMLAMAAARLGFDAHVYSDEPDSPASRVAAHATCARFDDRTALSDFAQRVGVVTTEFENVPVFTANALMEAGALVRPNPRALAIGQDRVAEKAFFNAHGVATAPFAAVDSLDELRTALARIGAPAILKTRRLGYDGRGQARIARLEDAPAAFAALEGAGAILEGFCAFEREVSLVAARGADGGFAAFDVCENQHAHGILARTIVPARVSGETETKARAIVRALADALDYVGVLTVEFFVMPDGALIANEMAPRVHNSGHWTEAACLTSQFEQHIRAVAGWPLGPTDRLADVEMTNLIGADANDWAAIAADPAARLHLYGKRDARDGRKMGHVTRLIARA